jgi:tRNA1Val (adenine37-N6)-methyltransferase
MAEAERQKLAVTRVRMVHGLPDAEAKVFLAELVKGRGQVSLHVLPPLIVRTDAEQYTDEARKILGI